MWKVMKKENVKEQQISITVRFFVSFFLVLCLPIIFFVCIFFRNYTEIYREKIIEQAQSSLTTVGNELERSINSLQSIVEYNSLNARFVLPTSQIDYRTSDLIDVLQAEKLTHSSLQHVHYYNRNHYNTVYSNDGAWNFSYFSRIYEGMEEEEFRENLDNLGNRERMLQSVTHSYNGKVIQYIYRSSSEEWWIFVFSTNSLHQILNIEGAVTILQNTDGESLYETVEYGEQDNNDFSDEYELTFESSVFRLVRYIDNELLFAELNDWQNFFILAVFAILFIGGVLVLLLTRYNESPIRKFAAYCKEQVEGIPEELSGFEVFHFAMKTLEEQAVLSENRQERNRLLVHLIYGRNCNTDYFRAVMKDAGLFQKARYYQVVLLKLANGKDADISKIDLYFNMIEHARYEYRLVEIPIQGVLALIVGMEDDQGDSEQELRWTMEDIADKVNEDLCFYVGGKCTEWNQISLSYFQALACSQTYEESGKRGVYYYKTFRNSDKGFKYPHKEIEILYGALVATDIDKAFRVTERLIEIWRSYGESQFVGVSLYYDILNTYYKAQIKLETDEESEFLKIDLMELDDNVDAIWMIRQIMAQYENYVQIIRKKQKNSEVVSITKTDKKRKEDTIAEILAFIEENRKNSDLSVSMVSEHFEMSISLLSHKFKNQTGYTISDYITEKKFSYACELLVGTEYSVKDISYMIGYSASISFIRKFKQQYGMTPIEYRKGKMSERV